MSVCYVPVTIAENSTWDADLRCTSCSRACRLLAHCWCSKCLSWRQMKAVRMLQASLAWKLLPGTLFYAPGFSQICLVASFPFLTTSCHGNLKLIRCIYLQLCVFQDTQPLPAAQRQLSYVPAAGPQAAQSCPNG